MFDRRAIPVELPPQRLVAVRDELEVALAPGLGCATTGAP